MVTTIVDRPSDKALDSFRHRVRAFIGEHAPPPIEAREGSAHRRTVHRSRCCAPGSPGCSKPGSWAPTGRWSTVAGPITIRCMTAS